MRMLPTPVAIIPNRGMYPAGAPRPSNYAANPAQPVLGSFKKGGKVKKTGNYKLHKGENVVPTGKLTAAKRSKIPAGKFGLPGSRKYPMPDKSHAANAKARATQQVNKGNLSPSSAARIRAKANRVLGKS